MPLIERYVPVVAVCLKEGGRSMQLDIELARSWRASPCGWMDYGLRLPRLTSPNPGFSTTFTV
jgi:hypothetical protein